VPTVSHSSNTVVYVGYGNASITLWQGNVPGTWDSHYQMVTHLSNGPTLNASDSTSNAVVVTNQGATAATGEIGGGAALNGSYQYIDLAMNITYPQITVEAWFNSSNLANNYSRVVANSHTDSDQSGFQLMFNKNGNSGFFDIGNGHDVAAGWGQALLGNTWYHYVGTYDGTTVRAYLNGVQVGVSGTTTGAIRASGYDPSIGRNPAYNGDYLAGVTDEVRISNIARSADWIATQYHNQSNPANFVSMGAEQSH